MRIDNLLSPKVAVLISTFNGENYLNEQLISILSQNYDNFKVYVRDDGSVDGTVDILTEFMKRGLINLIEDKRGNLGPSRSFLTLVGSIDAEIFMFGDQDDVWLDNKITKAVEKIGEYGYELPTLFYSDLRVVDKNGKLIHNSFFVLEGISNPQLLCLNVLAVQNSVVGCTVAFTNSLKQKIFQADVMECDIAMHDWWFAMYAACLGKLIYDPDALILYRQHENNVSGASINSFLSKFFRFNFGERVSRLRKYKSRIAKQARSFLIAYEHDLSVEQRATLHRISRISGRHWVICWVNCLIHGVRFEHFHMNVAFLLFPSSSKN